MGAQFTPTTFEDYMRQQSRAGRVASRMPRAQDSVLATIDPFWTSGLPSVIIDGEPTARWPGFPWDPTGGWTPTPGQRVWLTPAAGVGWIIGGPVTETYTLMRTVSLIPYIVGATMTNYDLNWKEASVSKSTIGIISLQGLPKTTKALTSADVMFQLPPGMRPWWPDDQRQRYPINNSDGANTVDVWGDGRITPSSVIGSGTYVSLNNIAFPGEDADVDFQPIGAQGSGDPISFVNGWQAAADTTFVAPSWWLDPYGMSWWAGLITNTGTPVDNNAIVQVNHLSMGTLPNGSYYHFLNEVNNAYSVMSYGQGTAGQPFGIVYKGAASQSTAWTAGAHQSLACLYIPHAGAETALAWTAGAFASGWSNYSTIGQYPVFRFGKRPDGLAIQSGLVKGTTTGSVLDTAPAGFRVKAWQGATSSNNGQLMNRPTNTGRGRLDMGGNGVNVATQGGVGWYSLDGIIFTPEW